MKEQNKELFKIPDYPFVAMRCGAAGHAFGSIPQKIERYTQDKFANILTYSYDKLTITVDGIKPVPHTAWRMLDYFMQEYTRQNTNKNSTSVEIEFDAFAEYRDAKSKQQRARMRQQMQEDLDSLYKVTVEWNDPKKHDFLKSRLIYEYGYLETKKIMLVTFIPAFAAYMTNGYLTYFNTRLGKLDGRNPYIYQIARKLIYHYMMMPNKARGINNRLSLIKLLEAVPDIPTIKEIYDKYSRGYIQKIYKPVDDSLEKLVEVGILKEFTWCKSGNVLLTQYELKHPSWDIIKKCTVNFDVNLEEKAN